MVSPAVSLLDDPILRTTFSALAGCEAHRPTLTGDDIVYVQTHYLWRAIPELAKRGPVVLVTHGSDATATDELGNDLPPNVIAWYSMNCAACRASALPIGLRSDSADCPLLADMQVAEVSVVDRNAGAYLCATWNNSNLPEAVRVERRGLYERFSAQPWCTRQGGNGIGDVPFADYCHELKRHRYVLCPRGAGYDSHRLWEALYLGAIPVLIRSRVMERFADLPALWLHDWSQLTERLMDESYERLTQAASTYTTQLTATYWTEPIRNAIAIRG